MRIGGQQQDRRNAFGRDDLGRLNAVHFRHFDVENQDVRLQFARHFQGFGPVARLADHLMPHIFQRFSQIQPNDRLIVRDYDSQ